MDIKRPGLLHRVTEGRTALADPSPRGDLTGSLAIRAVSLRALIPPPRSTPTSR
jgi:hypothetical protein